jgi:outer membrane lipoprotein LolB
MAISGCSTLTERTAPAVPLAPRLVAESFTASGRIAVRTTGDSRQGFSGGFAWTHSASRDVVELMTPMGQIAARVTATAEGAEIGFGDGRRTIAADPEQFLSDALGVTLPITALPYWMQAVPLVRFPFRAETDATGRPTAIFQNGWQIRYTAYSDETPGAHPTRLLLTQGDVEARMIISEFNPQ